MAQRQTAPNNHKLSSGYEEQDFIILPMGHCQSSDCHKQPLVLANNALTRISAMVYHCSLSEISALDTKTDYGRGMGRVSE